MLILIIAAGIILANSLMAGGKAAVKTVATLEHKWRNDPWSPVKALVLFVLALLVFAAINEFALAGTCRRYRCHAKRTSRKRRASKNV